MCWEGCAYLIRSYPMNEMREKWEANQEEPQTNEIWTCADLMNAAKVSVTSYVCQYCGVWKTLFRRYHVSPLALTVFLLPSLPYSSLSSEGRDGMKPSHFTLPLEMTESDLHPYQHLTLSMVQILVTVKCVSSYLTVLFAILQWHIRASHIHGSIHPQKSFPVEVSAEFFGPIFNPFVTVLLYSKMYSYILGNNKISHISFLSVRVFSFILLICFERQN